MPSGALMIFPNGQRPVIPFRRRGLGQEDPFDYYIAGEDQYYETPSDYGYSDSGYSDYDLFLYEMGWDVDTQGYPTESDFLAPDWTTSDPELIALMYPDQPSYELPMPTFENLDVQATAEADYAALMHTSDLLVSQGILGTDEAAAWLNGELTLDEALNISGYFGAYSQGIVPPAAQQAVADAKAKEDAAKRSQAAAASGGGGMTSGGGSGGGGKTAAQQAAQQQLAQAKTPAEVAAAQAALARANAEAAAGGSWLEKSSLIPGVKNLYLVIGGAAAFLILPRLSGRGGGVSYTTIAPPRKSNPHRRQRYHGRRR